MKKLTKKEEELAIIGQEIDYLEWSIDQDDKRLKVLIERMKELGGDLEETLEKYFPMSLLKTIN